MGDDSKIEWTDATWNPVRGCVKVSPGCANCYAETFAERWRGVKGHPYEQGFDLRLVPEKLQDPLRWTRPRRVFVNSMSDLFQVGVPDEYVDQVFAVMALARRHTFQVLTKRADRMHDYLRNELRAECVVDAMASMNLDAEGVPSWPLPNVWLGTSVENQKHADVRIPYLLKTPAAVRFVSAEPLLGPLFGLDQWLEGGADNRPMWTDHIKPDARGYAQIPGIDWVIVGGESGPGSRPCDVKWVRDIVDQCRRAGVKVFVKQLGASPVGLWSSPLSEKPVRARLALQSRKGGDPAEWPEDLRVREFPGA